ncbi:unnamed protein product [Pleuronectes platessa]|uniref:Uncharacterized protein n=1 Tax=Pleuronectes platessa TaxID=8262 RepID=A0A9N7TV16_PLEPL|nr:unnamed protein product [Pleuronectes platessa]
MEERSQRSSISSGASSRLFHPPLNEGSQGDGGDDGSLDGPFWQYCAPEMDGVVGHLPRRDNLLLGASITIAVTEMSYVASLSPFNPPSLRGHVCGDCASPSRRLFPLPTAGLTLIK